MHSKEHISEAVILEQMLRMLKEDFTKTVPTELEPTNKPSVSRQKSTTCENIKGTPTHLLPSTSHHIPFLALCHKLSQVKTMATEDQPKFQKPNPKGFMSDLKAVTCQSSDHRGGGQGCGHYSSGSNSLKSLILLKALFFFIVSSQGIGYSLSHERAETVQLLLYSPSTSRGIPVFHDSVLTSAFVIGQPLNALLDTGSSVSLIKHEFVSLGLTMTMSTPHLSSVYMVI